MAVICYKPHGSCPSCEHHRFDEERGELACFLTQDLKAKYPKGTRVVIHQMHNNLVPAVAPSTVGTVDGDSDAGLVYVTQDDGKVTVLVPGVDEFSPIIRKTYGTPLLVQFSRDQWGDFVTLSSDACDYQKEVADAITEDILQYKTPDIKNRGLAVYLHEGDLANKVYSIQLSTAVRDNRLWGVITCELHTNLTPDEQEQLLEYISGQFSDGWGEGFAERHLKVSDGYITVAFWDPQKDNTIKEF